MTLNEYKKDKRNRGIFQIICILIGCILLLSIFIHPVNAGTTLNSTLYVTQITPNTITWTISYFNTVRATGALLDGIEIVDFNGVIVRNFTASDLEPNTTHEFCIYKDLVNCEKGTTLSEPTTKQEDIIGFIFSYIWWIAGASLLVCAIAYKSSMLGFISAILTLIGMIKGISDSSFYVFLLYLVTFICAYLVTESIKER